MAECSNLGSCPFFNDRMKGMEAVAGLFKSRLCLGDSSACARHMVLTKLGKASVPPDLYPNDVDRARSILDAA
jgi:hypothetical protein